MRRNNNLLNGLILAGGVCIASAQTTSKVDMAGTVNDSKSGSAIAGATVTLANNPTLTTTTNASGEFHLTGIATGVRAKADMGKEGMSLSGTSLSINVLENNTPMAIDVFNIKSEHVKTVLNQKVSAGRYDVNLASSELPGGLYIVRAQVGARTSSFKVTALGVQGASANLFRSALFTRTALSKVAADPIDDTIKVTKTGYRINKKAITLYNTIYPILMSPSLPPGDLKIVSERPFPQVDWGYNVDVQVWESGTQLDGGYKPAPFEGTSSWMITFLPSQSYSAWGFVSKVAPEDMSAWKGGTMHLAVKGTVSSIGVTMGSANQGSGSSVKVNLVDYGYKPDAKWHEAFVPLDKFVGTDLSQVNIYCGLVTPVEGDSVVFNPSLFYQVDDIYWSLKK